MKSQLKLSDTPEADEFFRRGDEALHVADSLQPTVSLDDSEAFADPRVHRTPAQRERRARLIKFVSLFMAFLTVAAAGAFVSTLTKRDRHEPAPLPLAATEAVSVAAMVQTPKAEPIVTESLASTASSASPEPAASSESPGDGADVAVNGERESSASDVASASSAASEGSVALEPGAPDSTSIREDVPAEPDPARDVSTKEVPAREVPAKDQARADEPASAQVAVTGAAASSAVGAASAAPASAAPAAIAPVASTNTAASTPKPAEKSVAKASRRVRVAAIRRPAPSTRTSPAKTAVRRPETAAPANHTPAAKPDNYRPPTASFADE